MVETTAIPQLLTIKKFFEDRGCINENNEVVASLSYMPKEHHTDRIGDMKYMSTEEILFKASRKNKSAQEGQDNQFLVNGATVSQSPVPKESALSSRLIDDDARSVKSVEDDSRSTKLEPRRDYREIYNQQKKKEEETPQPKTSYRDVYKQKKAAEAQQATAVVSSSQPDNIDNNKSALDQSSILYFGEDVPNQRLVQPILESIQEDNYKQSEDDLNQGFMDAQEGDTEKSLEKKAISDITFNGDDIDMTRSMRIPEQDMGGMNKALVEQEKREREEKEERKRAREQEDQLLLLQREEERRAALDDEEEQERRIQEDRKRRREQAERELREKEEAEDRERLRVKEERRRQQQEEEERRVKEEEERLRRIKEEKKAREQAERELRIQREKEQELKRAREEEERKLKLAKQLAEKEEQRRRAEEENLRRSREVEEQKKAMSAAVRETRSAYNDDFDGSDTGSQRRDSNENFNRSAYKREEGMRDARNLLASMTTSQLVRAEDARGGAGQVTIAGRLKNIEDLLLRVLDGQKSLELRLAKIEDEQASHRSPSIDIREMSETVSHLARMLEEQFEK